MYLSHLDAHRANDDADRSMQMLATVILTGFLVGVLIVGIGLWIWLS